MTTASVSWADAPSLIDVDCNLWHEDLHSLQGKYRGGSANDDDDDDNNNNNESSLVSAWNMLHEDAIAQANVVGMLSPSSTLNEANTGLQRLLQHPPPISVRTTVGVHPYHVHDEEFVGKSIQEHADVMKSLLLDVHHSPWVAAVGECGLDASEGFPPLDDQLPWFEMQVQLAEELGLPLFVHERLAFAETMRVLENVKTPTIIHCFTGTRDECRAYVERGFSISISGYILKDRNDEVRACLQEGLIPLDRLMIETDAPYMGFDDCRKLYLEQNTNYVSTLNSKKKKRLQQSIYPNVPSSLPQVLSAVTDCLKQHDVSLTREQVAAATTQNAQSFFGF